MRIVADLLNATKTLKYLPVESRWWGTLKMQNVFLKLSDTPSRVRTPAPTRVGEHNDEVYRGLLGMDDAEIAALRDAQAG